MAYILSQIDHIVWARRDGGRRTDNGEKKGRPLGVLSHYIDEGGRGPNVSFFSPLVVVKNLLLLPRTRKDFGIGAKYIGLGQASERSTIPKGKERIPFFTTAVSKKPSLCNKPISSSQNAPNSFLDRPPVAHN